MSNLKIVQSMYEAFGRGDVPLIISHMAPEVVWEYGSAPHDIPWLQVQQGSAGVTKFFESLAAVEFHKFVPKVILEGPDLVVALIDLEFTVKKTGRKVVETDEPHIWHFNKIGKVIRFRHAADTLQHWNAYRG